MRISQNYLQHLPIKDPRDTCSNLSLDKNKDSFRILLSVKERRYCEEYGNKMKNIICALSQLCY